MFFHFAVETRMPIELTPNDGYTERLPTAERTAAITIDNGDAHDFFISTCCPSFEFRFKICLHLQTPIQLYQLKPNQSSVENGSTRYFCFDSFSHSCSDLRFFTPNDSCRAILSKTLTIHQTDICLVSQMASWTMTNYIFRQYSSIGVCGRKRIINRSSNEGE